MGNHNAHQMQHLNQLLLITQSNNSNSLQQDSAATAPHDQNNRNHRKQFSSSQLINAAVGLPTATLDYSYSHENTTLKTT